MPRLIIFAHVAGIHLEEDCHGHFICCIMLGFSIGYHLLKDIQGCEWEFKKRAEIVLKDTENGLKT